MNAQAPKKAWDVALEQVAALGAEQGAQTKVWRAESDEAAAQRWAALDLNGRTPVWESLAIAGFTKRHEAIAARARDIVEAARFDKIEAALREAYSFVAVPDGRSPEAMLETVMGAAVALSNLRHATRQDRATERQLHRYAIEAAEHDKHMAVITARSAA